jgi:hypothetical protein
VRTPPGNQQIELLFVDDDRGNYTVVEQRLIRLFEDRHCPVRLKYEADPDEACHMIATRPVPYQVVIADLLWDQAGSARPPHADARGLEVVAKARMVSNGTVVVAITQGSLLRPELERLAEQRGADIVLKRGDLLVDSHYGGPEKLVQEIYDRLCERELVDAGPVVDLKDEPDIEAIQDDTGKATLRLLLADLLRGLDSEPERAVLSHVAPGRSGAHVIHADVRLSGGERRSYFVKLSKDRKPLERELASVNAASGPWRPGLVVPLVGYNEKPAGPRNEWWAIAYVFADAAIPLRKWLCMPDSAPYVSHVMEQLFFNHGLADGYKQSLTDPDQDRKPMDWLVLPPYRRARLRQAVEKYASALADPRVRGAPDVPALVEVLERFSRTASFGGLSRAELPGGLRLVEGHGDLHGGNIMVIAGRMSAPAIIDLASFGWHHWAVDIARLIVDMMLECVDYGVESMHWDRFGRWRDLARSIGELTAPPDHLGEPNLAVLAGITWLVENSADILRPLVDPSHQWEWHVALAEQLVRRACSDNRSDPKRACALVAAYDQLVRAGDTVPRPAGTF